MVLTSLLLFSLISLRAKYLLAVDLSFKKRLRSFHTLSSSGVLSGGEKAWSVILQLYEYIYLIQKAHKKNPRKHTTLKTYAFLNVHPCATEHRFSLESEMAVGMQKEQQVYTKTCTINNLSIPLSLCDHFSIYRICFELIITFFYETYFKHLYIKHYFQTIVFGSNLNSFGLRTRNYFLIFFKIVFFQRKKVQKLQLQNNLIWLLNAVVPFVVQFISPEQDNIICEVNSFSLRLTG